jgi:hypothetical protein
MKTSLLRINHRMHRSISNFVLKLQKKIVAKSVGESESLDLGWCTALLSIDILDRLVPPKLLRRVLVFASPVLEHKSRRV